MQSVIFSNDIDTALDAVLADLRYNKLFVITDVNVNRLVMPHIMSNRHVSGAEIIVLPSGDINKNIETLSVAWRELGNAGATRHSLVLNVGGGVVTDLGGFAASTFKRGVPFINIPTTLLAAVDAAVGGKTGVNFNGLKNEIGVFCEAEAVIISSRFFSSLSDVEVKSGYGEMIKHALLSGENSLNKLLEFDFGDVAGETLLSMLAESVEVKRKIVADDPHEQGIRKALNLGHTVGHAFESLALSHKNPVPHGYAVAWGLITELVLSHFVYGFSSEVLNGTARYIVKHYGSFQFSCADYDALIAFMRRDKKSASGELNFSLLGSPGAVRTDCVVKEDELREALDITRDIMGI